MVDVDGGYSSLPPKVTGSILGYLDCKVTKVVWTRRKDSPIKIKVYWWGQDYAEFVFRLGSKNNEKLLHTYSIHTTLPLFRGYLKNCQSLSLSVFDEQMGTLIGTCVVNDLNSVIQETPTESFYPILNEFNSLIGNLRVSFKLSLLNSTKSQTSSEHVSRSSVHTYNDRFSDLDTGVNNKIIQKVLNQGQRLRNAMVETILDNDPLNQDIIKLAIPNSNITTARSDNRVLDYLLGYEVSDERKILDTIRSTSPAVSLIKLASNIHFENEDQLTEKPSKKYERLLKPQPTEPKIEFLKYVDSIKIYVHTLTLNSAAWRMLSDGSMFRTYFIEYQIPQVLTQGVNPIQRGNKKNQNSNSIRLCSRKVIEQVIQFKQQTVHNTGNIEFLNLSNIYLEFKVHSRSVSQRGSVAIGIAKYNLFDVLSQPNLSCDEELTLLDTNKPLTIGSLKVRIQFGCDKLHFGKDFIDAISCEKTNRRLSGSSDSIIENSQPPPLKKNDNSLPSTTVKQIVSKLAPKPNSRPIKPKPTAVETKKKEKIVDNQIILSNTLKLLRGLIFIPEITFDTHELKYTYIICRSLWREDTTKSKICQHTQRAVFNFFEVVPILYNSEFLTRTKNNYLVVEVWRSGGAESNSLLGICKLPLHQFYIAYRDPKVANNLAESKFPVISFDGWEDVIHPISLNRVAQLHALIAVGTEDQLKFLEDSRGINQPSVIRSEETSILYTEHLPPPITPQKSTKPDLNVPDSQSSIITTELDFSKPTRADKQIQTYESQSTQTDFPEKEVKMASPNNNLTRDNLLTTFMELATQLPTEGNKVLQSSQVSQTDVCLENKGSNTDHPVRETSKLLEKLQKALSEPPPANLNLSGIKNIDLMKKPSKHSTTESIETKVKSKTFKAHIVIESAVKLSMRRRRTKNKNFKSETLPSTYVSFEPIAGQGLIFTKVVQKSASPKWNQHFECLLPIDLLYDDQKRLIFKVWTKTTGDQPNMISDTVIGFAALDLTVLNNLSTIHAWFNISDFSSRCNGQIKINITPLEDISKYSENYVVTEVEESPSSPELLELAPTLSLSNTLKRKFTELDEITERLKQRLMTVTTNDIESENDSEFELDLNTEPPAQEEDEFDFTKLTVATGSNEAVGQSCFNTLLSGISTADSGFVDPVPNQTNISEIENRLKGNKMQFDALFEKLTHHSRALDREEALDETIVVTNTMLDDITEESEETSKRKSTNEELIQSISSITLSSDEPNRDKMLEITTDSDTSFDFNSETLLLNREGPEGAGNPSTEK